MSLFSEKYIIIIIIIFFKCPKKCSVSVTENKRIILTFLLTERQHFMVFLSPSTNNYILLFDQRPLDKPFALSTQTRMFLRLSQTSPILVMIQKENTPSQENQPETLRMLLCLVDSSHRFLFSQSCGLVTSVMSTGLSGMTEKAVIRN